MLDVWFAVGRSLCLRASVQEKQRRVPPPEVGATG
jgi:hypothetical protein